MGENQIQRESAVDHSRYADVPVVNRQRKVRDYVRFIYNTNAVRKNGIKRVSKGLVSHARARYREHMRRRMAGRGRHAHVERANRCKRSAQAMSQYGQRLRLVLLQKIQDAC